MIGSPVRVVGSVYNKTGIVHLEATADYTLVAECARCSSPIRKTVTVPVSHVLITHENEEDSDEYIVVDGAQLDLRQLTLEDIFLSLPSKLLCSEDCKGLCPYCGADLNTTTCACKAPGDPRFDVLRSLMNE